MHVVVGGTGLGADLPCRYCRCDICHGPIPFAPHTLTPPATCIQQFSARRADVGPSVGAEACSTTLGALSSLAAVGGLFLDEAGEEVDGGSAFMPGPEWIEAALECSARCG